MFWTERFYGKTLFQIRRNGKFKIRSGGASIIKSRIGLYAEAEQVGLEDSIKELFAQHRDCNVIISDESQFFAPEQIDELRDIVDEMNIPVMCFGLRTDFITKLFPAR